ncbi:MAG: hypothetical protein HQL39_05380 [Alphaproteobacteria bacterium]|nr:hypothetical protein [Alphaproteobacteria bacterium]
MTEHRQPPPSPFTLMLEWQNTALRLWYESMLHGARACGHVVEAESRLLKPEPHRRSHNEPPHGPRLDDHYGRREHDVDVEHL